MTNTPQEITIGLKGVQMGVLHVAADIFEDDPYASVWADRDGVVEVRETLVDGETAFVCLSRAGTDTIVYGSYFVGHTDQLPGAYLKSISDAYLAAVRSIPMAVAELLGDSVAPRDKKA